MKNQSCVSFLFHTAKGIRYFMCMKHEAARIGVYLLVRVVCETFGKKIAAIWHRCNLAYNRHQVWHLIVIIADTCAAPRASRETMDLPNSSCCLFFPYRKQCTMQHNVHTFIILIVIWRAI